MMKKEKIKVMSSSRWKLVGIIVMMGVGLAICLLGNAQGNPMIIALGFFLLIGGVFLFLGRTGGFDARILPGRKKLAKPANTLVIYPGDIEFDYIKKPPGYQLRCINDGKWYTVLIGNSRKGLKEFQLPDVKNEAQHYDPREFANPVTMPANKKLFEPAPNFIKTIAVGVMGIVVCVLGIIVIAMSG